MSITVHRPSSFSKTLLPHATHQLLQYNVNFVRTLNVLTFGHAWHVGFFKNQTQDKQFSFLLMNKPTFLNCCYTCLRRTLLGDFKKLVQRYQQAIQICISSIFLFNSSKWHVMQYKFSPNDKMWSPKEGLAIQLWKSNDEGRPEVPSGVLKPWVRMLLRQWRSRISLLLEF